MSVDFPKDAALCQRFLSTKAQFVPRPEVNAHRPFARSELFPIPLADPRAPSIVSKRKEPAFAYKGVNLLPKWRCLCGPKVIIDHQPATVFQQVTVAIQITAHVVVRVENEQAHVSVAQPLTNFGDCCLVEGTPVDQTNVSRYAESREILSQIVDDIPARQPKVFQLSSGFDAYYRFPCPRITRAKGCRDGGSANVRADLEDIPLAGAREVIDQKQDVHVQHRGDASDFF
jgi:hypothetical protein